MDTDPRPVNGPTHVGLVAAGSMMLVVGLALWLDTTGAFDISLRRLIGPLVLITLGLLTTFAKGGVVPQDRGQADDVRRRRRPLRWGGRNTGGVWLIGIGLWMMVAQTHAFGFDYNNSWPLFIILSGIMMLIRGLR